MAEYNSKQISMTLGNIEIVGFGESTMVSWEWESELTTTKVGVDGVVSRAKTNDFRGTVTFTLMETSPSNAVLAAFALQSKIGDGSVGSAPLGLKNILTGEQLLAPVAWVAVPPSGEFGTEASEREWKIMCANLSYAHAGLQPA